MVFSWQGSADQPDVDGFHVYNVAGHVFNPSLTSSAGGTNTVVLKKGPLYPVCYVIRAYKGAGESADSQPVCLAGGSSSRTVFLDPINARSSKENKSGSDEHTSSWPGIEVGYMHTFDRRVLGDFVWSEYYRAGVQFDARPLNANFIFKAVLHLHLTSGQTAVAGSTFPTHQCISEVGLGTNPWWSDNAMIAGDFSNSRAPAGFIDSTVDVTSEVRMFKNNANFGFVMRGPDENLNAFTQSVCESHFGSPKLFLLSRKMYSWLFVGLSSTLSGMQFGLCQMMSLRRYQPSACNAIASRAGIMHRSLGFRPDSDRLIRSPL
jgi:hypothetical protein